MIKIKISLEELKVHYAGGELQARNQSAELVSRGILCHVERGTQLGVPHPLLAELSKKASHNHGLSGSHTN